MVTDRTEIALVLTQMVIDRERPETVAYLHRVFDTCHEAIETAGEAAPSALALLLLAGKVLPVPAPLETFGEFAGRENARNSYKWTE